MDTEDMVTHDFTDRRFEDGSAASFRDVHEDYQEDVDVRVWHSEDGAVVVQIDYAPSVESLASGRLRVNVNDASVYDRNPETDEDFGDELGGIREAATAGAREAQWDIEASGDRDTFLDLLDMAAQRRDDFLYYAGQGDYTADEVREFNEIWARIEALAERLGLTQRPTSETKEES